MKIVSDALSAIATTLDMEFIRSLHLSEANVDVHYKSTEKPLMIYNGKTNITTQFNGAEIIDLMDCQIYFLVKKTTNDITGAEADDLLEVTKRLADGTYAILNPQGPIDIEPYTLEEDEQLTDLYIGHLMSITIPFENAGCFVPAP